VPELPEAETIVRGLREHVLGERVRRVQVVHADVLREPKSRFVRKVRGRQIESVERRGKNVLFRLDGGPVLAVNLGMTGRLLPFAKPPHDAERPTHPAVRLGFESGGTLVFNDTRRFGAVECMSAAEWAGRSERMGPEPLDPAYTARLLSGRPATSG
jgi:formamidopyrimidine-DNA glycosylase